MLPGPAAWPTDRPEGPDVTEILRERVESTPNRTALVDADTDARWTYAEFEDRVARRAAVIDGSASGDRTRVGLLLNTRPAFAETSFAVARLGRTAVPLNVRLDAGTLARQVDRANLDLLVCGDATETTARSIAGDEVPLASVDAPGSAGADAPSGGPPSEATSPDPEPTDERLVLFTSGTTGPPKGVRLTTRNLVASANGSADRLGVEPQDRWLVCLPMYHMGGLAPLVRSTLYGTTTVLQSEFEAEETERVVADADVSCVSLVPTMLTRLLDAGWSPPERLRFVLLGGGPAPQNLVDRCEDRGIPVCPTYGATETASQVATARSETAFEYPGTVGRPLRGTQVTVLDDSGAPVNPGDVGEVAVDGPTVTPGYLDDGRSADAFGEYGFETGDLGYRDEGGRLWVVGRVDDRILTGGENVDPATVASAIRGLAGVDDVAVVGVPDDEWGECVAALVESTDPSLSASTVLDHCRGRLADYEVPKTVEFAAELPRTASGTIDREAVQRRVDEERSDGA